MTDRLQDVNVVASEVLTTPAELKRRLPITADAEATVLAGRATVRAILDRRDPRLFLIAGPCSIHDVDAAMDYAARLRALARRLAPTVFLIMRVYFEKPRTTIGWKGLINDPDMDDSFHIERGIYIARQLLLDIARLGLPTATEALDPVMPQYLGELITWTAIGARTTESQTHREMASGLSTPVGIKNGTDGSLAVALDALQAVRHPHHFLGISQDGQSSVFRTRGNAYGHVVLRGGASRTNFDPQSIASCEEQLRQGGLPLSLVVDCSHGNSGKDPSRQPLVARSCIKQIVEGNRSIVGLMLESNLEGGSQVISSDRSRLRYGVSVTDACLSWTQTEALVLELAEQLVSSDRFG